MSLDEVHVVSDVLHTCTVHALTTSSEEIMGILLGDIIKSETGKSICRIWRAVPQIRTDRRKDRVEPSHQQLSDCISKADELTKKTDSLTRVVGWYHSHPNITVQPSHIDLRTQVRSTLQSPFLGFPRFQAQHQSLDSGFVGLIISCFNGDQVLKCTAFQTLTITSTNGVEADGASMDVDDEEMKEAMRLSLAEAQKQGALSTSTEFEHKEIPIKIVKPALQCEYSLMDIANLHKTLYNEEALAYNRTLQNQQHVSNLVRLYQSSVYYQSLIQLINGVLVPNLNALSTLGKQNEVNLRQLDAEIEHYEALYQKQQSRNETALNQMIWECPSLNVSEFMDEFGTLDTKTSPAPETLISAPQRISDLPSTSEPHGAPLPYGIGREEPPIGMSTERQMGVPSVAPSSQERRRPNVFTFADQQTTASIPSGGAIPGRPVYQMGAVDGRQQSVPQRELSTSLFPVAPPSMASTQSGSRVPSGRQFVPFVTMDPPTSLTQRPSEGESSTQRQPLSIQRPAVTSTATQRVGVPPSTDSLTQRVSSGSGSSGQTAGARRDDRKPAALERVDGRVVGSISQSFSWDDAEQVGNVPRMEITDDYAKSEKKPYRHR